jgi:hypothetical protein
LWAINTGVLIAEITQHLPTYIARIRLRGQVITTSITATNLTQACLLLAHLYGGENAINVGVA